MSKTIITGRSFLQVVVLHGDKTPAYALSAVLFTLYLYLYLHYKI